MAATSADEEIAVLDGEFTRLRDQSKWPEAMPLAERLANLVVARHGENSTNAAHAIHWWAWLVQENGDYDKAEELWLRALRIDETLFGKDSPGTTRRMHLLANCYRDQGYYRKALPYLQKALAIREQHLGRDHQETAQVVNSLGVLEQKIGNFAGAEANFLRALAVFEKQGSYAERNVAGLLSALGWLYAGIGDLERSREFIGRSLDRRKELYGLEHVYTANAISEMAMLHRAQGQLDKAMPLYRESLAIFERLLGTNHLSLVTGLTALGTMYASQNDLGAAEPFISRARVILERNVGHDHPRLASLLLLLARVEETKGCYAKARDLCHQAYAINESRFGSTHRATLSCLRQLARLDVVEGRPDKAIAAADRLQRGEEELMANVLSFTSERQRLAAQRDAASFQRRYDLWATIGAVKPLARAILRTKGLVLDSLIEDRLLAEAADDPNVRELIEQITRVRRGLPRAMVPVAHRRAEFPVLSDIEDLEARLARRVKGRDPARRALTIQVEQVLAVIPEATMVVEILRYRHEDGKTQPEDRYGALLLSRGKEPKWIRFGAAQDIDRTIKLYQHAVGTPHDSELARHLRALYEHFRPILGELPAGARRIIVSPDSEVNYVSFAALLSPAGRFLGEDFLFSYVSCARDLLMQNSAERPALQLAVWAAPDFGRAGTGSPRAVTAQGNDCETAGADKYGPRFVPLPGAEKEGRHLYSKAGDFGFSDAVFYHGAGATEAELQRLPPPQILHLATHAFVLPQAQFGMEDLSGEDAPWQLNPMLRSGLALAGARRTMESRARGEPVPMHDDGIVTADEIASLNLRGTQLVVLSACDTGGGEARAGEGVLGLRRGFVQAGAQNLVLTLWPIQDGRTDGFMAEFYAAMHNGASPPRALAEVQRQWLRRLRREKGTAEACRVAGPFILSFQGGSRDF